MTAALFDRLLGVYLKITPRKADVKVEVQA